MFIHPEMRIGEVYYGNYTEADFADLPFKTKRMGKTAYDRDNNEVASEVVLYPVFVERTELVKAGIDPDD